MRVAVHIKVFGLSPLSSVNGGTGLEFEGIIRFKIWMDFFFSSLQDFKPLEGENKYDLWIRDASKKDEGVYTCVCTWMHSQSVYRSSGSRRLVTGEAEFSGYQDRGVPLGEEGGGRHGDVGKCC